MTNKVSRPISVWIVQIIFILFIVLFSIGLLRVFSFTALILNSPNKTQAIGLIIGIVIYLFLIILMTVGFWGLAKRKAYGRWISVAILSLFLVQSLLSKLNTSRKGFPFEYYEYNNNTELIAGAITQIILYGLLLALVITLVKSKKVQQFFENKKNNELDKNL